MQSNLIQSGLDNSSDAAAPQQLPNLLVTSHCLPVGLPARKKKEEKNTPQLSTEVTYRKAASQAQSNQ
jgi:hypothetical protein